MPPGSVEIRILAFMTVPIPSAAPGLSVVTVGWLLELSFRKPYKMRSLMA